ncbi:MAG: hypothetical protein COZ91_03600 [Candidatus Nealsonbacteria bacterium CG_4_8_14_3_um_filter_39_7]|uniref:Uncharacterized protein n=1 Tax=Candidatus Nealsonbacteria bacterium CG23_combo_of_CG06-09_8_20_14_all_39_17 TaxID=1974722 RepID=A0A2G9YWI9_9BACT|nr:MAG: hypothetical protein COX37_00410 [Candidatus Nealsonbacteria bacterium CG23_combo_of_CG06-09_8_20_14_all_39_17]PIU44074.1 MAG: hypothetical protein COS96_00965 [Candidatus Nealsonbacteria bacterium CG07_land_8_20_14_0_80_39_13]PIW90857.1 MAG: hypothetical protein COZ91_03600 [Candidatus Nealsonbacteria bacterium CG_4_8_14_3_um_filter_39_7]
MSINWKVWAPISIATIVAFATVEFYQSLIETFQAPITAKEKSVKTIPATGSVDDAVNAIIAGASDDQALFIDAEKDADLITADNQAINDFGQSYDENEF